MSILSSSRFFSRDSPFSSESPRKFGLAPSNSSLALGETTTLRQIAENIGQITRTGAGKSLTKIEFGKCPNFSFFIPQSISFYTLQIGVVAVLSDGRLKLLQNLLKQLQLLILKIKKIKSRTFSFPPDAELSPNSQVCPIRIHSKDRACPVPVTSLSASPCCTPSQARLAFPVCSGKHAARDPPCPCAFLVLLKHIGNFS